jgi:hypothetical protein
VLFLLFLFFLLLFCFGRGGGETGDCGGAFHFRFLDESVRVGGCARAEVNRLGGGGRLCGLNSGIGVGRMAWVETELKYVGPSKMSGLMNGKVKHCLGLGLEFGWTVFFSFLCVLFCSLRREGWRRRRAVVRALFTGVEGRGDGGRLRG